MLLAEEAKLEKEEGKIMEEEEEGKIMERRRGK